MFPLSPHEPSLGCKALALFSFIVQTKGSFKRCSLSTCLEFPEIILPDIGDQPR